MRSELSFYQCKIDCYIYKIFYVSFMATTRQKPTVDSQKIKRRNQSLPLWKIINSQRKVAKKGERIKGTTKQP